ncbi:MAG: hypothetical protein EOO92_09320 [Pedobacter sp.]|nr:MAG: hypothetical protein EOO92_09320 [Pedobacter sp.]
MQWQELYSFRNHRVAENALPTFGYQLDRGFASKQQIAYAKVSLNLVDVQTSAVIVSSQGAGEYSLSQREVVGFGGTSSYDATLNGKVLDLAIREAVSKLAQAVEQGTIKP